MTHSIFISFSYSKFQNPFSPFPSLHILSWNICNFLTLQVFLDFNNYITFRKYNICKLTVYTCPINFLFHEYTLPYSDSQIFLKINFQLFIAVVPANFEKKLNFWAAIRNTNNEKYLLSDQDKTFDGVKIYPLENWEDLLIYQVEGPKYSWNISLV